MLKLTISFFNENDEDESLVIKINMLISEFDQNSKSLIRDQITYIMNIYDCVTKIDIMKEII